MKVPEKSDAYRDQNSSSALRRDGSLNKLANQKQLGPSALKDRKPLANWPKDENQNSKSRLANATPLKSASKKDLPPYMTQDDDEDYEEGFEDGAVNDDGVDEIEKLKQAMAKEKEKAFKFNLKQGGFNGSSANKQRENPMMKGGDFIQKTKD